MAVEPFRRSSETAGTKAGPRLVSGTRPAAGLWNLLRATYGKWSDDQAPRMGAALAYYTIFSLAPLLVIAISVAGLVFGQAAAQGRIVDQIQGVVGHDSAVAIQHMIESAHRPGASTIAAIIGLIVLLFGASGVFAEMQDALNAIWEVKASSQGGIWAYAKQRFWSFSMVLGIGFLLLVSLLLTAALSAVAKFWSSYLPIPAISLHAIEILVSIAVITLLFAMIFKILPQASVKWADVWRGALMTAVLFTLGKFLIGLLVGKTVSTSTYGAASALVVVVAWVYYSAQIVYFGAEFTRVYALQRGSELRKDQSRDREGAFLREPRPS